MGGPRLSYFALRPMNIGGTVYAVGDVVDVSAMTNDTVTGLVRSGWLATSLAGDIRSAVVQAAEPTSPSTNDLWIDSDALSFLGARVTDTTDQSLANGAFAAINFDTEAFDEGGFHDNATNNSRLTVPSEQAGKYLIMGQITFASTVTGSERQALIKKNGTSYLATQEQAATTGADAMQVSIILDLIVGDYVELFGYQDSGGAINVTMQSGGGDPITWFSIVKL